MRLNIFKLYKNIELYWAIYQRYEKVILPRNRPIFFYFPFSMSLLLPRKYIAIKLWDIPFTLQTLNLSLLCDFAMVFDFKKTNIVFRV